MLGNKYGEANRISGCKEKFLPNVFNKKNLTKDFVAVLYSLNSYSLHVSLGARSSCRVLSLKDPTLYHLLFIMVYHLLLNFIQLPQ